MAKSVTIEVEVDDGSETLTRQVFAFFGHTLIAIGTWGAMMLIGYVINPPPTFRRSLSPSILSLLVPLVAGMLIVSVRPSEMAPHVWLAGIIWMLFLSLWLLDLPHWPQCLQPVRRHRKRLCARSSAIPLPVAL